MFLSELNLKQRKAFIELAYYTAKIDNIFAKEEKYFIEIYKREAGIEYYDVENKDFDEMISVFEDKKSRNIVLLETTALIYADKKLAIEESKLLKELQKKFNFSNEDMKKSENWVKNYLSLLDEGIKFIND